MEFLSTIIRFLLVGGSLACIATWGIFVRRIAAGQDPLPFKPRRVVPWGLIDVALAFLLFVGLQMIAVVFAVAATGVKPTSQPISKLPVEQQATILLAGSVGSLAAIVLAIVFVFLKNRVNHEDFGFAIAQLREELALGILAFFFLAGPVFLIQALLVRWWPSQHPLIEMMKKDPSVTIFLICGFSAVLVAPFAEEMLFRVLLQGWLERMAAHKEDHKGWLFGQPIIGDSNTTHKRLSADVEFEEHSAGEYIKSTNAANPFSPPQPSNETHPSDSSTSLEEEVDLETVRRPSYWPIFASAACFALMHYSHGPDPVPLFILAIGLGYLYQQTHRVLPCIIVHFLLNSFSMLMLLQMVYE